MTVVDLFSGCGCLTLGLAEAARRSGRATRIVLAVDNDKQAVSTYARNFPGSRVRHASVEDLFDGTLDAPLSLNERRIVREVGTVDFLLAGPPCQGHSDLNNHTRRKDPRNDLYLRAVRACEVLRPRFLVIENVPAVLHDRGRVVEVARSALAHQGYSVAMRVVHLEDLGVPQRRRRHILLATREPNLDPVAVLARLRIQCTHGSRTVRWAIGDLENQVGTSAFDIPSAVSPANLARIQWLMTHDEYDLPNQLRPPCHHGPHSYRSMYGRLWWDRPAQTVTSGFGSMGQGRYVHPSRPTTITPHEAARLQGIPDFFDLGAARTRSAWARMIGNAVPPFLMINLGSMLLDLSVTGAASKEG
ncbi:MAG: DNA cytosine methyltransferase, partial [Bacteroidota bacterium]